MSISASAAAARRRRSAACASQRQLGDEPAVRAKEWPLRRYHRLRAAARRRLESTCEIFGPLYFDHLELPCCDRRAALLAAGEGGRRVGGVLLSPSPPSPGAPPP